MRMKAIAGSGKHERCTASARVPCLATSDDLSIALSKNPRRTAFLPCAPDEMPDTKWINLLVDVQ
jgi:hypothetical protein